MAYLSNFQSVIKFVFIVISWFFNLLKSFVNLFYRHFTHRFKC